MNTFRLFLILLAILSMLNGAFMRLEDTVRHHLDGAHRAHGHSTHTIDLTDDEFRQRVDFVRNGLLDQRQCRRICVS